MALRNLELHAINDDDDDDTDNGTSVANNSRSCRQILIIFYERWDVSLVNSLVSFVRRLAVM